VDAVLYWELARSVAPARVTVPRLPQNFNWPRFRELFTEKGGINEEVRINPWLADWPAIAAKIAASGFDKRRLVPEKRGELLVPLGPGPWAGTSPFAEPLCFDETPVFPVKKTVGMNLPVDTWVSAQGLLRCSGETWILLPWD
jgi:hypothetical protein